MAITIACHLFGVAVSINEEQNALAHARCDDEVPHLCPPEEEPEYAAVQRDVCRNEHEQHRHRERKASYDTHGAATWVELVKEPPGEDSEPIQYKILVDVLRDVNCVSPDEALRRQRASN